MRELTSGAAGLAPLIDGVVVVRPPDPGDAPIVIAGHDR
jgi:hypothetical protein